MIDQPATTPTAVLHGWSKLIDTVATATSLQRRVNEIAWFFGFTVHDGHATPTDGNIACQQLCVAATSAGLHRPDIQISVAYGRGRRGLILDLPQTYERMDGDQ